MFNLTARIITKLNHKILLYFLWIYFHVQFVAWNCKTYWWHLFFFSRNIIWLKNQRKKSYRYIDSFVPIQWWLSKLKTQRSFWVVLQLEKSETLFIFSVGTVWLKFVCFVLPKVSIGYPIVEPEVGNSALTSR